MQEIYQLVFDEESERYELDGQSISSGTTLFVYVWNGLSQKFEWVETSMEFSHSRGGYYLTGLLGYQVGGLFAHF